MVVSVSLIQFFFNLNFPKLRTYNPNSDRHIDMLLLTEVAFLQSNIGHQNLL